MREDRKADDTQCPVVSGDGRLGRDEVFADTRLHHRACSAQPEPDGRPERWHKAVGMHSALHWTIGLPSRASSAARMLAFLTPADVRRSFMRCEAA